MIQIKFLSCGIKITIDQLKSKRLLATQVFTSASVTTTEYNRPTTVTAMVPATLMSMGVMAARDITLEAENMKRVTISTVFVSCSLFLECD